MHQEINIESIIENVKIWIKNVQTKYDNFIKIETITDEDKVYRAILNINSYMAQIVIDDQDFAPYNHIAFEIVGMENGKANMIYCWYDNGENDINTIIEHLDIGLFTVLFN